jgi:hemerythrin-like metal-binding protein
MPESDREPQPRKRRDTIKHLVVGHDAIDADHKVIVECCNQLGSCTAGEFEFLVRRLRNLLADHFRNEAALLEAAGSKLCGCHQRDHDDLLEICDRTIKLHRQDHRAAQRIIREDLARALRLHIAYRDQIIALRLNTAEFGNSCPGNANDKNQCG